MAEDETDASRPLVGTPAWNDDDLAEALAEQLTLISPSSSSPVVDVPTAEPAAAAETGVERLWPPLLEQLSELPAPTGPAVIVPGAQDGFRSSFVPPRPTESAAVEQPAAVPIQREQHPPPTPRRRSSFAPPTDPPGVTSPAPAGQPQSGTAQEPQAPRVAEPLVVSLPVASAPILYDLVDPLPPPVVGRTSNPFRFPPPTDTPAQATRFLPPPPAGRSGMAFAPPRVDDQRDFAPPTVGEGPAESDHSAASDPPTAVGSEHSAIPEASAPADAPADEAGDEHDDDAPSAPAAASDALPPALQGQPSEPRPRLPPALSIEQPGEEPTPLTHRVGRAARVFWLWFPTNSSVLSLAFGGALLSLGMSLRQAIVAAFLGVTISVLPLGLGTLAGKWSGQPTMVVSRATFGVVGNVVPAAVALLSRLFWGAVLLWLAAVSAAHILSIGGLAGGLSERRLTLVAMAAGVIVALAVATLGYSLIARIQAVLSVLAAVLVIAIVIATRDSVDLSRALTVPDGPWLLIVTGIVLVFSFVGLAWVNSGGDLARYQRPASSGAVAMLAGPFGVTLPALILIVWGSLLAASHRGTADGLLKNPLDTIAAMLPSWYPIPLVAATAVTLLSGVVLSMYSGGFALQAIGLRVHRAWSTVIIGVLVFGIAVVMALSVTSVVPVFRDLATTIAVPVAAWAGIFSAEMIIRRRRFDTPSLLSRQGVYGAVNWLNLSMFVVAAVLGLGLTTATIGWLHWQGYLFRAAGVPLTGILAASDVGVLVALVVGFLTPFVTGFPKVRRQERAIAPATASAT